MTDNRVFGRPHPSGRHDLDEVLRERDEIDDLFRENIEDPMATSTDPVEPVRRTARTPWRSTIAWMRAFARHPDPLVEASNWVAILVGTHLPFWPLYVRWSAGAQALPTALLTTALAPLFLVVPLLSRRSGLAARVATPLVGIVNTVFTAWVLGMSSGTALFLAPCAALAAFSFRRRERWPMLVLTLLPLAVYFGLRHRAPEPLHRYDPAAAASLVVLNAISVGVLAAAFGWLQADIYRRMEARSAPSHDA